MSRTSTAASRKVTPRGALLAHLRQLRQLVDQTSKPWRAPTTVTERVEHGTESGTERHWQPGHDGGWVDRPTERTVVGYRTRKLTAGELPENSYEQWSAIWRAAQAMRIQVDQMATYAAQQMQRTRPTASPIPVTPIPEMVNE